MSSSVWNVQEFQLCQLLLSNIACNQLVGTLWILNFLNLHPRWKFYRQTVKMFMLADSPVHYDVGSEKYLSPHDRENPPSFIFSTSGSNQERSTYMPAQAMEDEGGDSRNYGRTSGDGNCSEALDLSNRQCTKVDLFSSSGNRTLSGRLSPGTDITTSSVQTSDLPRSSGPAHLGGRPSDSSNNISNFGFYDPSGRWLSTNQRDSPINRQTMHTDLQNDLKLRLAPTTPTISPEDRNGSRIVPHPPPGISDPGVDDRPKEDLNGAENVVQLPNRTLNMFPNTDSALMYNPLLQNSVMSPSSSLTSLTMPTLYDSTQGQTSLSPSPMSPYGVAFSSVSALMSRKRRQEMREREKKDKEPAASRASTSATVTQAETSNSSQEMMDESEMKKAKSVPDERKDEAYWERRRKNNEAAKRSRDARRQKEEEIAMRAAFLEQENLKLRAQVAILKNETAKLHCLLYNRRV